MKNDNKTKREETLMIWEHLKISKFEKSYLNYWGRCLFGLSRKFRVVQTIDPVQPIDSFIFIRVILKRNYIGKNRQNYEEKNRWKILLYPIKFILLQMINDQCSICSLTSVHCSLFTDHWSLLPNYLNEKDFRGLRVSCPFILSSCSHPHSQREGKGAGAKTFDT